MKQRLIILSISILMIACNSQSKLTDKTAANEICDCYYKQDKNNNKNLSTCFDNFMNKNENQILIKKMYPNLAIDKALIEFSRKTYIIMIQNCDLFYRQLDSMYSDMYHLDTTKSNLDSIEYYSNLITHSRDLNNIKSFRHKRLSHLLMARNFKQAQIDIDTLKSMNEVGAYLAGAWSMFKQSRFNESLSDIDKALSFGTNPDIIMFREIIKKNCK